MDEGYDILQVIDILDPKHISLDIQQYHLTILHFLVSIYFHEGRNVKVLYFYVKNHLMLKNK